MTRIDVLVVMVCVVTLGWISHSDADLIVGWVDEFTDGHVEVYSPSGGKGYATAASTFNPKLWDEWAGGGAWDPTWDLVGQQTGSPAGRANARAKVMFRFAATNTDRCGSATASINRFRRRPPPTLGASCTGGNYVGTASQTFDSCAAGPHGRRVNNRMLPVFDFTHETTRGDIGYRDEIVVSPHSGGSLADSGCYIIRWL